MHTNHDENPDAVAREQLGKDIQLQVAVKLNMQGFHWRMSHEFGRMKDGEGEIHEGAEGLGNVIVLNRRAFSTEGRKEGARKRTYTAASQCLARAHIHAT